MALELDKRRIECEDVKKCGEITTLLSVGKQEFFLNCGFCDYTFLQLDSFIEHMNEEHLTEFVNIKLQDTSDVSVCSDETFTQSESAVEENDEIVLNDFERVEIELGIDDVKSLQDIKDDVSMETYLNEGNYNNFEDTNDADLEANDGNGSDSEAAINRQVSDLRQMYSEKTLSAILSGYEKRPTLWDTEVRLPIYSRKRIQLFKNIAIEVGLPSEWDNIRKLIGRLSARLHTELLRKKIYKSKGRTYIPAWYVDLNSFLKPRRQSSKIKPQPTLKKFLTPETLLSDAQCLLLAKIYKNSPGLWDERDITYRFSNRRREAMKSIREEFNNKSGLSLTQSDVEKEIARLRKICSNEKKQKIICKRQNLVYKPSWHYYDRISFIEVDVNPYECLICSEVVSGACQYKIHLSSHDGSLPFKCNVCGHGFKLVSNLTVHLRRHVHDFMYNCEVCQKPCATASELKIHMRYHTGEMPYVCDVCGNKFRTGSDICKHMERHEKQRRYKCEICSKSFYRRGVLREHISTHTNVRDKICNVCNKGFTSNKQLRQHQHIHDEEKKYLCKICGKRFAQNAGLSGHMKSHGTNLSKISGKNVCFE